MKRVWWETIYRIRNEFRIESLDSRSVRNDSFSLCSPRWLSVVEIERKITFKSVEFSSGSVRNRFSFSSELIRTERLFFFLRTHSNTPCEQIELIFIGNTTLLGIATVISIASDSFRTALDSFRSASDSFRTASEWLRNRIRSQNLPTPSLRWRKITREENTAVKALSLRKFGMLRNDSEWPERV